MRIEFISGGERKEVLRRLKDTYGLESVNYLLVRLGKDKIRGFSGHMSREEIMELYKLAHIEGIGLYLAKKGEGLRLSYDATQVLKPFITKNIFKMSDDQFKSWIKGGDIDAESPKGVLVMEHDGDLIGCGKSNGERIFNQIPKERRIKLNRKV